MVRYSRYFLDNKEEIGKIVLIWMITAWIYIGIGSIVEEIKEKRKKKEERERKKEERREREERERASRRSREQVREIMMREI